MPYVVVGLGFKKKQCYLNIVVTYNFVIINDCSNETILAVTVILNLPSYFCTYCINTEFVLVRDFVKMQLKITFEEHSINFF